MVLLESVCCHAAHVVYDCIASGIRPGWVAKVRACVNICVKINVDVIYMKLVHVRLVQRERHERAQVLAEVRVCVDACACVCICADMCVLAHVHLYGLCTTSCELNDAQLNNLNRITSRVKNLGAHRLGCVRHSASPPSPCAWEMPGDNFSILLLSSLESRI